MTQQSSNDIVRAMVKSDREFTETDRECIDKAIAIMTSHAGDWIKKWRTLQKLSLRELSRRSGVSSAVISELECYKSLPKIDVLARLMYAMDMDFHNIFTALWDARDPYQWAEACGKKYQPPKSNAYIITDDETIKLGENINSKGVEVLSLYKILSREGLSSTDIKEVLEFIDFKKSKRKKK